MEHAANDNRAVLFYPFAQTHPPRIARCLTRDPVTGDAQR